MLTSDQPAVVSTVRVLSALAKPSGPGSPGDGGAGGSARRAANARRPKENIAVSSSRQHTNVRDAPGAAADRMFANATCGSAKNITPNRDTTRSKGSPGAATRRSVVCASAATTVAVGTRRLAASTIGGGKSISPTAAPAGTAPPRQRPAPQTNASTRPPQSTAGP